MFKFILAFACFFFSSLIFANDNSFSPLARHNHSFTIDIVDFGEGALAKSDYIGLGLQYQWRIVSKAALNTELILDFPSRGGFLVTPAIGLRLYEPLHPYFAIFIGIDGGWSISNVPWWKKGPMGTLSAGGSWDIPIANNAFNIVLRGGIQGRFHQYGTGFDPGVFLMTGIGI